MFFYILEKEWQLGFMTNLHNLEVKLLETKSNEPMCNQSHVLKKMKWDELKFKKRSKYCCNCSMKIQDTFWYCNKFNKHENFFGYEICKICACVWE